MLLQFLNKQWTTLLNLVFWPIMVQFGLEEKISMTFMDDHVSVTIQHIPLIFHVSVLFFVLP